MKRLCSILFATSAAISALLLIVVAGIAIRSYYVSEQWIFPLRPVGPPIPETVWKIPSGWLWLLDRRITSAAGYVEIFSQEIPEAPNGRRGRPNLTPGYHRSANLRLLPPRALPALSGRAGETRWTAPGIGFYSRPTRFLGASPAVINPQAPRTQRITVSGGLATGARHIVLSWWLLAAPFLIAPLLWCLLLWRSRRAQKRRSQSCCRACGYDLTGNTSGVCPECGMPVVFDAKSTPKAGR